MFFIASDAIEEQWCEVVKTRKTTIPPTFEEITRSFESHPLENFNIKRVVPARCNAAIACHAS